MNAVMYYAVCASTACNCNVIFLLDISGSVSGNTDKDGNSEISNLKNFTNDLIDRCVVMCKQVKLFLQKTVF